MLRSTLIVHKLFGEEVTSGLNRELLLVLSAGLYSEEMPTPSQLAAAKRASIEDPYFKVHEVVELVDEGEEGFGEEDLKPNRRQVETPLLNLPRVSQATFDAAVLENVDDFGMELKAAIAEAKKEFDLQGVSLDGIDADNLLKEEQDDN